MGTDRPDTLMRVAMVLIAGKASNAMRRGPRADSVLGGCDYSKGLLCCGLLKDSVMEQAIAPPGLAPWLWKHENTILVNMGELLTWIGSVKTRKTRKGTTVDFFCLELHRILWTVGWHSSFLFRLILTVVQVAYWCGCGRSAAVWGPPVDLGIGLPAWICESSEDASSVDALIATSASSTEPQIIGSV